jgi:hypothetical protein
MKYSLRLVGLVAVLPLFPLVVHAHCDTMDGPVIAAARTAFAKNDVTPVLKWVQPQSEAEIRASFERASQARGESPAAARLAETWFFETLVRVHRAGEGAPYTGLKAEAAVDAGIDAADAALESGDGHDLVHATIAPLQTLLERKYDRVRALQAHADESVAAGREYVAAYVDFVHFAERLAALGAAGPAAAHTEHAH